MTRTEKLVSKREYYGHKVVDFTYDGYDREGFNRVILVLDNGYCDLELLTDSEYERFVDNF